MKNNKIIKTASILGALALMVGGVVVADASMGKNANKAISGNTMYQNADALRANMQGLSEVERAEMLSEREDRRTQNRAENQSHREAAMEAISENSFEKWQIAVGENHPFADKINADNFSTFVEIHNSTEGMEEKLAELGIERKGNGAGLGHGTGVHRQQMINR